MIASLVWYAGLVGGFAGVVLVVRPIARLGVPSRRRAAAILMVGIAFVAMSLSFGVGTARVATPATLLDRFIPAFQFSEAHTIDVNAAGPRVYRALFEVTPEEISLYRTLTWFRRFGRPGPPGLLNPPAGQPILETALRTGFHTLGEVPDVELVFGTLIIAPPDAARKMWTADLFATLSEPGYAKVAMNFRVEPRGPETCVLHTETRVFATDAASRRAFTPYWRTIYPGSALIRRMWLRAVKARAERVSSALSLKVSPRRYHGAHARGPGGGGGDDGRVNAHAADRHGPRAGPAALRGP